MATAEWTIEELTSRVSAALAGDGYAGPPNGRVRDVPDARAIRWYATIGLVDRPAAMRGRTALYGERHLLQLVAVKRRQAQGRSLAEIQAELAGATDEALRAIAEPDVARRTTAEGTTPERATVEPGGSVRGRGAPGGAPVPAGRGGAPVPAEPGAAEPGKAPGRDTFWSCPPAPGQPTVPKGLLTGVPLEDGAMLLLPARPDPDDLPAIAAAARPLIELLAARGLLRSAI